MELDGRLSSRIGVAKCRALPMRERVAVLGRNSGRGKMLGALGLFLELMRFLDESWEEHGVFRDALEGCCGV